MSDRFQPLPLDALAPWIFGELEKLTLENGTSKAERNIGATCTVRI